MNSSGVRFVQGGSAHESFLHRPCHARVKTHLSSAHLQVKHYNSSSTLSAEFLITMIHREPLLLVRSGSRNTFKRRDSAKKRGGGEGGICAGDTCSGWSLGDQPDSSVVRSSHAGAVRWYQPRSDRDSQEGIKCCPVGSWNGGSSGASCLSWRESYGNSLPKRQKLRNLQENQDYKGSLQLGQKTLVT